MYPSLFVVSNFVARYIGEDLWIIPDLVIWGMAFAECHDPIRYHLRRLRDLISHL